MAVRDSNHVSQSNIKVVKTDELGEVVWERVYGTERLDEAYIAKECADSSIAVLGYHYDPVHNNQSQLTKLTRDGDSLWSVTYGGERREHSQHSSLQQTSDGGYITAQFSNSFNDSGDNFDVWVVRFGPDGTPIAEWNFPTVPNELRMSVFPNPFNSTLSISLTVPLHQETTVALDDLLGREVDIIHRGRLAAPTINYTAPATMASGIYFVRATSAAQSVMRKVVFLK